MMAPRVRFRCVLCGECCRRYWVPVTHVDVARIMKHTGLRPRDFLALFHKDMASDWEYPTVKLRGGEYYVILRKRLDGTCVFNKWVGDKLICSIQEFKPNTCRFYPFLYWIEEGVVKFQVFDGAIGYCPGLGRGGYYGFKVEVRAAVELSEAKARFRDVIGEWNRLVDEGKVEPSVDNFMDYLEGIARDLINRLPYL